MIFVGYLASDPGGTAPADCHNPWSSRKNQNKMKLMRDVWSSGLVGFLLALLYVFMPGVTRSVY